MKFIDFVVEAKKNTYASGGKEKILADRTHELRYEKGIYKYLDRYNGFDPFAGVDVAWEDGEMKWLMGYGGITIKDTPVKIGAKKIFKILKKALLTVNVICPHRGKSSIKMGEFYYQIFDDGTEVILCEEIEVYKGYFRGGLIPPLSLK